MLGTKITYKNILGIKNRNELIFLCCFTRRMLWIYISICWTTSERISAN